MEIKLNVGLQNILAMLNFLENLELETVALIMLGTLMTPFVIYSLWSLSIAVLLQLFWLGVKAGALLFLVSAGILAFLHFYKMSIPGRAFHVKCTLLDVLLSIVFHAGLRIPSGIWERLVKCPSNNGVQDYGQPQQMNSKKKLRSRYSVVNKVGVKVNANVGEGAEAGGDNNGGGMSTVEWEEMMAPSSAGEEIEQDNDNEDRETAELIRNILSNTYPEELSITPAPATGTGRKGRRNRGAATASGNGGTRRSSRNRNN